MPFRLVEQGRLRICVAFEEVNRRLIIPDATLKLQRARLLLRCGHKLSGREAKHAVLLMPFSWSIDQPSQSDAARQPALDRGLD
jgi:hypothetical protein